MIPKTGPKEGWRIQAMVFLPSELKAMDNPIVVMVFPSPSGVGVIAVTKMYLPRGLFFILFKTDKSILAL